MAEDQCEDPQWDLKYRSEEEMDFFTEMALHETERWMEAVTRQKFQYPDDPRKSLENGVLLCEMLNCLKAGSVKKINHFSTPLAGLDNINIFLEVCRNTFGLTDAQLFDAGDLEDLSQRAIADESNQLKEENDRRLRNVAVTIYWLGRVATASNFEGPQLDFNAFSGLFEHHHVNLIPEKTSVYSSYWENKRLQSNHTTKPGIIHEERTPKDHDDQHAGDSSYESIGSKGSDDTHSVGSGDGMLVNSDMYSLQSSTSSLNKANKVYSGNLENDMYHSTPNIYQASHRSSPSVDSADGMSVGGHSRQSSGSTDNYPTRSIIQRSTSVSVDPLQFVKPKENALAKQAEHQLKIAIENREAKVPVSIESEEDWQSNLKSWKTRRRQSYHRSIDQEEVKDEPVKRTTKTYKEMVAEREKRRSLKIPFYADEEQNEGRNFYSTSDDNLRASFSSESGNSTTSHDDVFHAKKNPITSERTHPVINKIEKQEPNVDINSNNTNNNKNNYNVESSQKESSHQPVSESEKLVGKEIDTQDGNPESSNNNNNNNNANASSWRAIEPQVASVAMLPVKSEKTNARMDKSNKGFVERIIKISQKLKSEKGFGFLIKGGTDQKTPITVQRIQLGSAADVCELRSKDVIVSINKVDVRQFTQQKAQQQIDKAAQIGQIELRVRRYFRGSAAYSDDNLDLLSDEEPEVEHIPRNRRLRNKPKTTSTEVPEQPLPPLPHEPLINETENDSHIAQPMFPDVLPPPVSTDITVPISDSSPEEILPPPPPLPTTDEIPLKPAQHPERISEKITDLPDSNVTETPKIRSDIQAATSTAITIPSNDPPPVVHQRISTSESVTSTSAIQPPALLLRWQSQNREKKTPKENVKVEPEASVSLRSHEPRPSSFYQNKNLYALDSNKRLSDSRFIVRDIRQSLEKEKNSAFITPVVTKTSVNSRQVPPEPPQQTEVSSSHIDVKSSPLVIQIPTQNNSDSPLQIDPDNQQMMQQQPQNGSNQLPEYIFRVDLNKKPVENELKSQITFSTESSLNTRSEDQYQMEATKSEELRIAEESRIAEERRLIEEEKQKRLQEDRARQEIEEKKRLEKKKEQIRLEEEKLAQKKRELELAQLEIEENRRRLQQEQQIAEQKKLQQEEQLRIKTEQLKKEEQLRQYQQQEQMKQLEEEKVRLKQLQKQIVAPVQAPQRYQPSPQPYHAAVSAETVKVPPTSQYNNQSYTTSQPIRGTSVFTKPYSSVQITHQKKPVLSGKMESVISRFDKPEEEVRHSQKFTREDLLAMNRKATPLQQKPEISPTSSQRMSPISREPPSKTELRSLNAVPKAKHRDSAEWIVSDRNNELERKPVNKSQGFRQPVSRQQEIQSSTQVHWVIEEAERRRFAEMRNPQNKGPLHDDYSKLVNYPIQPAESPNLWRDLPAASQKGFNQPLPKYSAYDRASKGSPNGSVRPSASPENLNQTNPRASYASYGSSVSPRSLNSPSNVRTPDSYGDNNTASEGYESLSAVDSVSPRSSGSLSNQTLDPNSNTMLISHQRDDSTSSKHSGKSTASSSSELNEQVAVCGTEKCSHCSKELGSGAAMVIESLSLYYHVKCFRCCVCNIQLGNGSQGADVRVRGHKLHCHNCYSNDEAGLKFSKV